MTIDFTRIKNDANGNPRYVCHFLNFVTETEQEAWRKAPGYSVDALYKTAITRANKLGGRKFHNKQYGGGLVFQSYSLDELTTAINKLLQEYK
jgi:hypothetical protein